MTKTTKTSREIKYKTHTIYVICLELLSVSNIAATLRYYLGRKAIYSSRVRI